jgi:polysaccharidase protein
LEHATPSAPGTYYVDSVSGSDSNNGTSISTPKQTIAGLLALNPTSGCTIFLKRGSVWREKLDGSLLDSVTIDAYGSGAEPKISAADLMNSSWTNTSGIVYQRTISIDTTGINQAGVWDLDGTSVTRLRKQSSVANVQANPGSFYYSGGVLYVSCFDSAAPAANQIEVAMRDAS